MSIRIAFVSCVKTKQTVAAPAEDLYISSLFLGMRRYAEKYADAWYILSAEHGLLRPKSIIDPYERTLTKMSKAERVAWAARVQAQLDEALPAEATIVLLAGQRYRELIVPFLQNRGYEVEVPMAGLPFGHQLRWLKEATS